MRRTVAVAVLVLGLAAALLSAPEPAFAATPDLTITSTATYDVRPDEGRVAVTVALKATNHLKDTPTKQFFFRTGYLAVLPGTSNFNVTGGEGTPVVSVVSREATHNLLKITFGTPLVSGATTNLSLTFDITDPGGDPDRAVRISPSIVTFSTWAFATAETPGSSVEVRVPAGYDTNIGRGPLDGPTTDGNTNAWTSGRLDNPLDFIADVTASKPGAYVEGTRSTKVGSGTAVVVLKSWPDDADWRDRMTTLFLGGLPVLGDEIGVDWPLDGPLTVQEAIIAGGGYAGLYDPVARRIDVAYSALPGVILHEAAHAWFNGRLVADRWEAEAFASYYGELAGAKMGVTVISPELTDAVKAAAIPLNAWGPLGAEPPTTEAYGYAASLALARLIGERAGPDAMQRVWTKAAADVGAYQPASGDPEKVAAAPDWRGLLDLLEDTTGTSFEDLWRQWVIRPEDERLLVDRAAARTEYDTVAADASPWLLPKSIRDAMRAWQFDDAMHQLADARAVVRQRAALEREAANAGVTFPTTLETAFEGSGGLAGALAEAAAELATVGAIESAERQRLDQPDPVQLIGLIGLEPSDRLDAARAAFAKGDLDAALAGATVAEREWSGAEAAGRGRLISASLLLVAILLLAGVVAGLRRGLHLPGRLRSLLYDRGRSGRRASAIGMPGPTGDGGGEGGGTRDAG
jgi:hypothetical protein